jgi:hypothetical protein
LASGVTVSSLARARVVISFTAIFVRAFKINKLARYLRRHLRGFCEDGAIFVVTCEDGAQNPNKTAKVAKMAVENS